MAIRPVDRHRHRRSGGQSTVEFVLVAGLVFLLLLSALQAGLYAVERGSIASATERAALVAAGLGAGGPQAATGGEVYRAIAMHLSPALIGASAAPRHTVDGRCPQLDASWPVGTIYVCTVTAEAGRLVQVAVRGWVPALLPPSFGIGSAGWKSGALPIDVNDVVHTVGFAP
jgi:Flp pilus assembly protein TadG